jgi:delta1-piperideine-2-carboxylate reductase
MSDTVDLTLTEAYELAVQTLKTAGLSNPHADAIARIMCRGQIDDCHSHGLYRLLVCVRTLLAGKVSPEALPSVSHPSEGIVRVDCNGSYSPLGFEVGRPILVEKAKRMGIAALAINHCFHFSALWPEVEDIAADGLAALCMLPSHSFVAPAGGKKPLFGTNPIAFAWPRPGLDPYVFDFATSVVARGEIELHRRSGRAVPEGWAVDTAGNPTTDATEALAGAMLTFGGHKGSALSTMIELLAGPLIGDFLSMDALEHADGADTTPYHGELVIAFDPRIFGGAGDNMKRAEKLFEAIKAQGARLPSERRYQARARNIARGAVTIPRQLLRDIQALRT